MQEGVLVVFYNVPLKIDKGEVEKILLDDPILNKAIIHYAEELGEKGIERN